MQLNTTKHSFVYFTLDLLGMSRLDLLVEELTAVCEKWQVLRRRTWFEAVLTTTNPYQLFCPWCLSEEGAESTVARLCHQLEGYCCCSQDSSYWGVSPGRSLGSEILLQ